jgi:hypothetical protein
MISEWLRGSPAPFYEGGHAAILPVWYGRTLVLAATRPLLTHGPAPVRFGVGRDHALS